MNIAPVDAGNKPGMTEEDRLALGGKFGDVPMELVSSANGLGPDTLRPVTRDIAELS